MGLTRSERELLRTAPWYRKMIREGAKEIRTGQVEGVSKSTQQKIKYQNSLLKRRSKR